MKKTMRLLAIVLSILMIVTLLVACADKVARDGLWKDATYTSDKTFGKGSTAITLVVTAESQSVTFTVNTDKETVGAALVEAGLIEGEDSDYGLMVTKVNGITADWNVDQRYWAFYIDGEYAMTGVDSTPAEAGVTYGFTYTK